MKKAKIIKIKMILDWTVKIIVPITAIVISIATVFTSAKGNEIAQAELERAEFARPIIYEIVYRDEGTEYEIRDGDTIRHIPAREPTINVTMGALHSITVFHYDGYTLHYKQDLMLSRYEIARPIITIQMPPNPGYLIYDDVLYDYMFLLMVPVEGPPVLHMLCVEIDINNGVLLGTEKFEKYDLLELELNAPISNARRHMLEIYRELMGQLVELEAKPL